MCERERRADQSRSEEIRAATTDKMTTLVIFLLLAQQLTAKPLIAGIVEGGDRDSEQRYHTALTPEQKADINQQIEILTRQERFVGTQIIVNN